jgi:hypothetical protein
MDQQYTRIQTADRHENPGLDISISQHAGAKIKEAWQELPLLALMLFTLLAVNLATSSRFPLPWQDEDVFTDVAVNLATGRGFISSVNMCGEPSIDHFWSCNAPMFPFLLGQWIKVFGFKILAVRSLNYVLISICVFVLWYAVRRLAIIPRAPQRLLFVALLMTGYGMGFIYRSARYDCLGLLLFSLALLVYSLRSTPLRVGVIALLGALLPLAGIQLVLFSGLLCALMVGFLRSRVLIEVIALGGGIVVGSAALLSLFHEKGVLANFLRALFGERNGRLQYVGKDPSFMILLVVCILLIIQQSLRRDFRLNSPLGIGLACSVLIPAGMLILGKFPIYYSWMAYVPLAMCVSAAISDSTLTPSPLFSLGRAGLFLVCTIGLPVQLASAVYYWNGRDSAKIEALVRKNLNHDDWVYTQYSGYFAVREMTPYVFIPFVIPDRYHDKITVLVVSPNDFDTYAHGIIGGEWRDTGEGISDSGHDLLPSSSFAILLQRRIDLRVYRRIETNPK